ncbi:hypothetical protein HII31_00043 [Pseudocercospora fuligena]|uniref:Uncharacterized protein n=1 Tax=Pseudocercospora fuligena TaxID=685502 RepID=A0A8H6RW31_9PEZI|nr:hypothetical protein HII31_00043 [Pseudocercospora fuligena]
MKQANQLLCSLMSLLQLGAALTPQKEALEKRGNEEVYSYTRMGPAHVHKVKTYHETSTRPCTRTSTAYEKHTKHAGPGYVFTTTTTTTKTVTAKTAYTSTIPASKGFIPIDESVPGASYDPAASLAKREAVPTGLSQPLVARGYGGDRMSQGNGHPQKVDVVHWKQASKCSVEKKTKTKTSVDCKKTVTKTATATYTKYPSTASPVYAACATDNIATAYKGLPLFGLAAGLISDLNANVTGYSYSYPNSTDSYSCCVAALLSSPPAAFWGLSESISDPTDNICIVVNLDGCMAPRTNPSTAGISFEIETSTNGNGTTDDRIYSAGNAYCGQWFRGCVITDNGTPDGAEVCYPPK